jgi:hypothetical protein
VSSTYNGANTFPVSITIPSDGDLATAGSVNVSLEALADRTVNLQGFVTGANPGATLVNPIFIGTLTISAGAIVGDGAILNVSQPGEQTRFLGATLFSVGNQHTVDGIMSISPSGQFIVQAGGSITVNASATMTINGVEDVFGQIVLHNPGYIQFRIFEASASPSAYTLSIQNGDEFFIDPTVSNMLITMADPPSDGLRVRFTVVGATNTTNFVNLARTDATSIIPFGSSATAALRNVANNWNWVDIVSRGGRWQPSALGKF